MEVEAGIPAAVAALLLKPDTGEVEASPSWDTGLLLGTLSAADLLDDLLAARLPATSSKRACESALSAPGSYDARVPEASPSWDTGLLLGTLSAADMLDDLLAARLPSTLSKRACESALSALGGYDAWALRSRTLARHFPVHRGEDFLVFDDYAALWKM